MRPAGELAEAVLARVRASPADLRDAAAWEGEARGAARLRRRLLLRGLAAAVLGSGADAVELAREPSGRPRLLAPAAAYVSVARGGEWAALAIARRPVGVDLAASDETADWSLLPQADRRATGDGSPRAFAAAWSAREAYLKATGAGLAAAAAVRLEVAGAALSVHGPAGAARAQTCGVEGWLATAVVL